MPEEIQAEPCTHACSYGCGRKYDAILIQVVDGSTLFLCMPDLLSLAHQMAKAMVEPEAPEVREVMANADFTDIAYVDPNAPQYKVSMPPPAPAADEFTFDGMSSG